MATPSDRLPLLSMSGIEKSFARIPALKSASLSVFPAEVMGLIGQNGAGKSTLIKILTGYYIRDAGAIEFNGKAWSVSAPHEAQAGGIATIYQEINLVGYRSVAENICLGRQFGKWGFLDWKAVNRAARDLLGRFAIDIDVTAPLEHYSTAIQQMVAIARAVGQNARLVIMDEPTSSLNEREVEVLFKVIRQLKAEGVAVIFVSHKLDELYEVCERVTILRDGQTVRIANMADISKLDLVATMLGRDKNAVKASGATGFNRSHQTAREPLFVAANLASVPRVKNVSIEVGKGEIVGVAGLLGSGRTETVRLIFGADPKDKGEMTFGGSAFAPHSPADAISQGLGFCTEDRKGEGIIPDQSVRENMTLALLPALSRSGIVDASRQKSIAEEFIRKLGIKCSGPEQPIRQLSGGNQQKVILARWLCMNPKLLILDEPTRGIDVGAKGEIQKLVDDLARNGLGVLMVSSELEEIVEGASRAFVLRDGVSSAAISGSEISEPRLMAMMAEAGGVAA